MNPIRSGFNSSINKRNSSSLSKNSSASQQSSTTTLMNESSFKTIFGEIEVLLFYNGVFRDSLVKTSKDYQKSWIFPNSSVTFIFLFHLLNIRLEICFYPC